MGYPITDVKIAPNPDFRIVYFEHGWVTWCPTTNKIKISYTIYSENDALLGKDMLTLVEQTQNAVGGLLRNGGGDHFIYFPADGGVQLFLDIENFINKGHPSEDFHNQNYLENHCGPVAAANLLRWYGVEADIGHLGIRMNTNHWKITAEVLGVYVETGQLNGTRTPTLKKVLTEEVEDHLDDYKIAGYCEQGHYDEILNLLSRGYPLLMPLRTGDMSGHFVTVVGVKFDPRNPNDPIIQVANPGSLKGNDVRWSSFKDKWKRYNWTESQGTRTVGEFRYDYTAIVKEGESWGRGGLLIGGM